LTTQRAIGITVGFIGVIIVLLPELQGGIHANWTGSGVILLSSLSIALATIYARKNLKDVPPMKTATGMLATAAVVGLPLTIVFERPLQIRPSTASILAFVALGVVCSAIIYLLYYWLVANRGATYASLVMITRPIPAIVLGAIFMGATLQWSTIGGMAVILLCIAIMDGFLDRFFHKPTKAPSTT